MKIWNIIAVILTCIVILLIGVCIHFTSEGCHKEAAKAELQQAKQSWQDGQVVKALAEFSVALKVGLECGVRYHLAQPYIDRMSALERTGRLGDAISACGKAAQALGGCDVEGSFDYLCNTLEIRLMLSPALTPTPDAEN